MTFMKTEDVKKLAQLSRVELTDNELEKMPAEFDSILGYIKNISAVASTTNESLIESAGTRNVTRPDEFSGGFENPMQLINSAPQSQDGYIKVKKVL
jgi:aspartyl-tRNA(Asn)/glutamyl-tRNA(Gln) amidotransferase subunit C